MELFVSEESEGFSQSEFDEIKNCLETLLSVRAGSQPLDRDFGIDYDGSADLPVEVAKNILAVEITEKIETYEPRVEVDSVTFKTGESGQLIPIVSIIKSDNEEDIEDEDEEDEAEDEDEEDDTEE